MLPVQTGIVSAATPLLPFGASFPPRHIPSTSFCIKFVTVQLNSLTLVLQ